MKRPILAWLFAGCTIVACSAQQPVLYPPPAAVRDTTPEMRLAIARLELDAALQTSDALAIVALLDTAATLRMPDGQIVRGRSAIAGELLNGWNDVTRSYRLAVNASESEECTTAIMQGGTYSMQHVLSRDSSVEREDGAYAIRWAEESGTLKADRLSFERGGAAAIPWSDVRCPLKSQQQFFDRRFEIGVIAGTVATASTVGTLQGDLERGGWTRTVPGPSIPVAPNQADRTEAASRPRAFIGARVMRGLYLQGSWQLGNATGSLLTYNPTIGSRLYDQVNMHDESLLALIGWHGLRVGAGPDLVNSSWSERYQNIVYLSGTNVYQELGSGTITTWSTSSIGTAAQASYTLPMAPWAFAELSARARWVSTSNAGGPTHENWSANLNSRSIGLGFGLRW